MQKLIRRWIHWLVLAAALAGVGLFLVWQYERDYAQIEAAERERMAIQSKVIEQNLSRQLDAINRVMAAVVQNLPKWVSTPDGKARAIAHLENLDQAMPAVRTFLVLNAKGDVVLSNQGELMNRNFFNREYFQAPLPVAKPRHIVRQSSVQVGHGILPVQCVACGAGCQRAFFGRGVGGR
jgi:hypothetical protein